MLLLTMGPSKPQWLQIVELSSSITILVALLVSAAILVIPRLLTRKEGKIKLASQREYKTRKGLFSALLLENIDDDLASNGEPVDLPGFWKGVSIVC
jgi:hypothetical protein